MTEATEELWRQAVAAEESGQVDLARLLWRQLLDAEPQAADVKLSYAIYLNRREEWATAVEVAAQVPHVPGASLEETGVAYSLLGFCHRHLDQLPEAEDAYRQALALRPWAVDWILLGETLERLSRDDEAMQCYREALVLEPDNDEAHYKLGNQHNRLDEYDAAEAHLRRAIELDPDYAIAYEELGRALKCRAIAFYRESGKQDKSLLAEAKRCLLRAVELDPNNIWSRVYCANLLWQVGNWHQAEEHYRAAFELWPDGSMVHWAYGDFLSATHQDHAKAGRLLKKAVELDPEDDAAHYFLGKHYLRLKRKAKARQSLEEAVRLGHQRARQLLEEIEGG